MNQKQFYFYDEWFQNWTIVIRGFPIHLVLEYRNQEEITLKISIFLVWQSVYWQSQKISDQSVNPALRLFIFKESFKKLGSKISDLVAISVIATFTGIFVCWERKNEDIMAKQVSKCFILVTNLETIKGEVLPKFFTSSNKPSKLRHFSMATCLKQHNTKQTNTNQNTCGCYRVK